MHSIQPGCSDNERVPTDGHHFVFSLQLGSAIGVQRIRRIVLGIGRRLRAVEDVVCREIDKIGADRRCRLCHPARAFGIDGQGRVWIALTPIHIRVARNMDDRLRPLVDNPVGKRRICQLKVGPIGENERLAGQDLLQLRSKLAMGTGNENTHRLS